ncbi:MAG TPA: GyrI-like domain-containing protein [Gemmatimonadales bacterium]|nr:GyrI-like domain-containing protein [Gemmatimonadales bacterium]
MIDTPHIAQTVEQPAAVLHLTIPRTEIRKAMGPGYAEVMAAVTGQGLAPVGPWFTHHLRLDPTTFDFEIGVPVPRPITATGRVKRGQLPAATVAQTVYHGPYERLAAGWAEFDAWIRAAGHEPGPDFWERYVTGPESGADPETFRTELNRPLVRVGG